MVLGSGTRVVLGSGTRVVLGVGRAEGPWTLVIEWDGQRDLAESSGMSECQGTVVVTAGSLWAQYGQGSRQLTK